MQQMDFSVVSDGKPETLEAYARILETLRERVAPDAESTGPPHWILRRARQLHRFLREKAPATREHYYTVLSLGIQTLGPVSSAMKDDLDKRLKKLKALNMARARGGQKSERVSKNWISWAEVEGVRDRLEKEVRSLHPRRKLTPEELYTYQKYVLLSLYTMQPPVRDDYATMRVTPVNSAEFKADGYNHLLVGPGRRLRFHFSEYKTSKIYGSLETEPPSDLAAVLHSWLPKIRHRGDGGRLLAKRDGGPMQEGTPKDILNALFQEATGKRGIGPAMLRRIYMTGRFGKEQEERLRVAKKMMHSVSMGNRYIKR
ncbi:MAG: hypothetical protein CMA10_07120 [Euryarchaeota archaeon]|nr:hypothetical protein [Euryarchaeota archaeon]|tara:strand:- start:10227 stop:11171 length:945 start_codon:yes stop_codon:yes gene_type:complete